GEAEVFERESFQAPHPIRRADFAFLHVLQQLQNVLPVHDCSRQWAVGSRQKGTMRSRTFCPLQTAGCPLLEMPAAASLRASSLPLAASALAMPAPGPVLMVPARGPRRLLQGRQSGDLPDPRLAAQTSLV